MAFRRAYLDPSSRTFSNGYQSAIAVGYDEDYANQITARKLQWFEEIKKDQELIDLSMFALKDSLTMDEMDKDRVAALTAIKQKSVQFVLSRLAKDKWSERQELTGAEGEPLIVPTELMDKYKIQTKES